MRKLYYGRISTTDGQRSDSQVEDARAHGVRTTDVFIDEGISGYHVAPEDRPEWRKVEHDLRDGGTLIVRWLDRISRRYDELHRTMGRLMDVRGPSGESVRVECTLNGMAFDGNETDPIQKAMRDAVLAFMAAQGEADYRNRAEMQRRGVAIAKAEGKYKGRVRAHDYAAIMLWRSENGATIRATADYFNVGIATVKRACAEGSVTA